MSTQRHDPTRWAETRAGLERLYRPAPSTLAANLPDIGDSLAAILAELARDPAPDKCDQVLSCLRSAEHLVERLRAVLTEDSAP